MLEQSKADNLAKDEELAKLRTTGSKARLGGDTCTGPTQEHLASKQTVTEGVPPSTTQPEPEPSAYPGHEKDLELNVELEQTKAQLEQSQADCAKLISAATTVFAAKDAELARLRALAPKGVPPS